MNGKDKNKIKIKRLIICIFFCCFFIILTVPVHEAAHWIMSEIDPYSEPIELHLFDFEFSNKKLNLLFLPFGYVKIKETYPGSFKDRPLWMDPIQELICFSIQILITYIIVTKILLYLYNKNQDLIKYL